MNTATNPNGNHPGRTLLAVLAHPDDESFGMGGTLALYAQRGAAVHLICATRGEAGQMDAELLEGFASTAEKRTAELSCAAAVLGLAGVHYLDYRDSGMAGSPDNQHPKALAAAPLDEVARRVASYIRKLRPQVVVTFDPIGGYKHPDHIAIHNATVRAFHLAGDPAFADGQPPFQPQKLYFNIIPRGFLRIAVRLLPLFGRDPRKFGRNGDINLLELANEGNYPVHARIDYGPVREKQEQASACHASQLGGGPPNRGPMRWARYIFGATDQFMQAYPEAGSAVKDRDLFAGIG
jgi:LmbE family N-acetylglucosaminyl deacetylase